MQVHSAKQLGPTQPQSLNSPLPYLTVVSLIWVIIRCYGPVRAEFFALTTTTLPVATVICEPGADSGPGQASLIVYSWHRFALIVGLRVARYAHGVEPGVSIHPLYLLFLAVDYLNRVLLLALHFRLMHCS